MLKKQKYIYSECHFKLFQVDSTLESYPESST